MAIPKVMISSTCYDLTQIRENIEAFIRIFGYDSIRSDRGDVGYNLTDTLKTDCFLAAQQCDILIGVIGGTFGSEANETDSVTMHEMKTALEYKKQIYIFVDRDVLTEFGTYKVNLNKNGEKFAKEDMSYRNVNDTRIFDFINEMYDHKSERVVVEGFKTSTDITDFLKKQWANLFQLFLGQKERDAQSGAYSRINESADRLTELLQQFQNNLQNLSAGTEYLLENQGYGKYVANPILGRLKKVLGTSITVLFKTPAELDELMSLFEYEYEGESEPFADDFIFAYYKRDNYSNDVIYSKKIIFANVFHDEKLIFPSPGEPLEEYIKVIEESHGNDFDQDDDDLPF